MKNKKVVILSCLVLAVWGAVIYRVIEGLGKEEETPAAAPTRRFVKETPAEEPLMLKLDYDDPFLKDIKNEKPVSVRKSVRRHVVEVAPQPVTPVVIPWEQIRFSGMLSNATRHQTTATVLYNDQEYFLREGQIIGDFTLMKIWRDSIQVGFQSYTKIIYKEKN